MPLVPGGSHGTFTTLRMIGTKRGQEGPVAFGMNPAILDELRDFVGVPLRLVHIYRNPWDNVASMMRQHHDRAIVRYFSRVRAIAEIKATGIPVHDLALEDLIARPQEEIASLLHFCDLEAGAGFLDASRRPRPRAACEPSRARVDPAGHQERRGPHGRHPVARPLPASALNADLCRCRPTSSSQISEIILGGGSTTGSLLPDDRRALNSALTRAEATPRRQVRASHPRVPTLTSSPDDQDDGPYGLRWTRPASSSR